MAIRYAVATGNWSSTATWDGGTLPTSADDVFTNNFVVTINQNVAVVSLSNKATTGVNAGGSFRFNNQNINIVATTITGGSVALLDLFNYAAVLNITANTLISDSSIALQINNVPAAIITINANIISNSINTTAVMTVIGLSATSITINGNLTANNAIIFTNSVAQQTITVNGFAQSSALASAITNTSNSITTNITITKAITVNQGLVAVTNTGALSNVTVKEIEQGNFGQVPISGYIRLSTASGAFYKGLTPSNTFRTLSDPADIAGQIPSVTDVRNGVTYQSGAKTGTAFIPSPSSVAFGVPVDNTTGSAVLTAENIWNTQLNTMTTSGSIGERLKNVATVQTTAAQIAAF